MSDPTQLRERAADALRDLWGGVDDVTPTVEQEVDAVFAEVAGAVEAALAEWATSRDGHEAGASAWDYCDGGVVFGERLLSVLRPSEGSKE